MKTVAAGKIRDTVAGLCIRANLFLRKDVLAALKSAHAKEKNKRARVILDAIIENARIAGREKLAICQDTGMPIVFLEAGQGVKIAGDLKSAINKGIESGYRKGYFRDSVIKDPLSRGRPAYQPAVIHADIARGNKLKITVLPKGFGCENKSALKMFRPTAGLEEIKEFIVQSVESAGPDACPPYIVGVGIGGTADLASLLAKKALLRAVGRRPSTVDNDTAKLEKELLKSIDALNIGPMGLGGKCTCLAVNIETYPTHISGLPVAVNISCHALRSASATL
jgi:fumarate hydratase subunit alpha